MGHQADDDFYQYQTLISSPAALFHGFFRQWQGSSHTADSFSLLIEVNRDYATRMAQAYGSLYAQEQARANQSAKTKRNKQEQETKLQTVLDQAKTAVHGCPESRGTAFSRLEGGEREEGLYSKYRKYNDVPVTASVNPTIVQANDIGGVSFGLADKLLGLMVKARDEWFIDEYALTYFNYRTFGKEEADDAHDAGARTPVNHVLPNQEVEYLLYGFASCEANYAAAYAEMFSLRLAIRTTEQLMNPENDLLSVGSPALVLLAALARGAADALEDMQQLLAGKDVPLMQKLGSAVRLNYRDYLRLFLLLHSSDRNMLSRMQALIELNTGKDLNRFATYLQATATTSTKLWFLPEWFRVFGSLGFQSCQIRLNQCEITRTAVFAY